MDIRFLKVSAIKKYYKENKKRSTKEAIQAIDYKVLTLLNKSIATTKHHLTVTETEINLNNA